MQIKKYTEIPEEALARLDDNKCVEGSLHRDKWTGVITFNMWKRKVPKYRKDKLIRKLPWGWVKESIKNIKVHGSFPKEFGTAEVMSMLDEHTHQAKDALIDREIADFV